MFILLDDILQSYNIIKIIAVDDVCVASRELPRYYKFITL